MKALKKALVAVVTAVLGCCFFVGCLKTKISVTYMVDGVSYTVQNYEMDETISLPTPPTKEGYTFVGWYTDAALTQPYAAGKISAGMTLYAKFSEAAVYYIIVNPMGGAKIPAIEVVPGGAYTVPEAVKEGYTFVGYTYIDSNGDEQPFPLTGTYPSNVSIQITAQYEINKYTVTFVGATESTQEVAYGSVAIAPATEKAGYDFAGWYTSETEQTEETKFDITKGITDNVTLYAKYTPKTFTITVNGAEIGYVNPTVVYGETYTLATPVRENHEFEGFVRNGEDFPATGVYTWTENIAVSVKWGGDARDVMFHDGQNEITDLRVETEFGADMTAIRLPNVPAKAGYSTDNKWYTDAACTQEFVASGTVTDDIKLYAKYTANEYTVTFMVWDIASKSMKEVEVQVTYGETFNAPARAERDAYNFLGYVMNGEPFDTAKAYAFTTDITVEEKWELRDDASLFEYNKNGNYFTERETYDDNWTFVFVVTATPYKFSDSTTLTLVNPADAKYATVEGNTLTAKAVGEFVVEINVAGNVMTRNFKTVEFIQSMSLAGTTYDTAWGLTADGSNYKRNTTDVWDRKVAVSAGEAMKVGMTNFIPELNINGKVTAFDDNFTATVEENGVAVTDYSVADGVINFGASLVGKKLTVTIVPKYAVHSNHKAVYTVEVNEAYNVYDDEDMKEAFANPSVSEINVLRNINPVLPARLTNTWVDEWGKTQISAMPYEKLIDPATGSYYTHQYSVGIYERRSGNLKINGNYFTVDGGKIPLTDARDGVSDFLKPGTGFGILDTPLSIFIFGRYGSGDMSSYQVDNLNIQGNGDMDASAAYKYDGVDVLKYSGATININNEGGYLTTTNVTSRFGAFGFHAFSRYELDYECSAVLTMIDCKSEKNWANNVYVQGFIRLTLDGCYIGEANGAAVHFDTRGSAWSMDSSLKIVNGTNIQNWVSGSEAWFNAQGLGAAIGMIKALAEPGVQQVTSGAKTLIKNIDGKEKINFAILVKQCGDTSTWNTDIKAPGYIAGGQDAAFASYLQSTYGTYASALDAAKPEFSYMDIEYAGYLQAANPSALGSYVPAHMNDQWVKVRSAAVGFLVEAYCEIVNA